MTSLTPTTVLEKRNCFRLPKSILATFKVSDGGPALSGRISDISENGIGFTLNENIQSVAELSVAFWLPFDPERPQHAMLEPIVVRVLLVASRYVADCDAYAYGGVFWGSSLDLRREIRAYLRHAETAAAGDARVATPSARATAVAA